MTSDMKSDTASDTPKVLKVYSFSQWQYSILLQERDQDMDTPFACNTCEEEAGILYVMSEGSDKSSIVSHIDDEETGQQCHRCLTELLAEFEYSISLDN